MRLTRSRCHRLLRSAPPSLVRAGFARCARVHREALRLLQLRHPALWGGTERPSSGTGRSRGAERAEGPGAAGSGYPRRDLNPLLLRGCRGVSPRAALCPPWQEGGALLTRLLETPRCSLWSPSVRLKGPLKAVSLQEMSSSHTCFLPRTFWRPPQQSCSLRKRLAG